MEQKNINDLKANPKNPRKIDRHDFDALVAAMKEFGDLSGIVLNLRTGQLVGGHQRTQVFKRAGGTQAVIIDQRLDAPNKQGTIAFGHVEFEGDRFSYREVDWDPARESSANIAANRIQGQFDLDMLAEITAEIAGSEQAAELLKLTGQTNDETERLLKMSGMIPTPDDEPNPDDALVTKLEFAMTREQREIVEEAIQHIKMTRDLQAEKDATQNGAALYAMSKQYLEDLHKSMEAPTQPAQE